MRISRLSAFHSLLLFALVPLSQVLAQSNSESITALIAHRQALLAAGIAGGRDPDAPAIYVTPARKLEMVKEYLTLCARRPDLSEKDKQKARDLLSQIQMAELQNQVDTLQHYIQTVAAWRFLSAP
jgi:hypothetical protein